MRIFFALIAFVFLSSCIQERVVKNYRDDYETPVNYLRYLSKAQCISEKNRQITMPTLEVPYRDDYTARQRKEFARCEVVIKCVAKKLEATHLFGRDEWPVVERFIDFEREYPYKNHTSRNV